MPSFRIFRMKEAERQRFRWAPHSSGVSQARPRDYEEAGAVEAESVYAAWSHLRQTDRPLEVGDILEIPDQGLRIYKYVGFEEARWVLPEIKSGLEGVPPAAGAARPDPL